ncbi:hypothetical protein KCU94_g19917, partial [Aureobasidium melanogenum]
WFNIGQFSNSRRRTEGTLASHRLKGENELHSLLQHSLCYFRAVAKQHEASMMKLPFGPKELQAYMPKVSINRPARKVAVTPVARTPTKSKSEQPLPEEKQQTLTPSLGPELEPWAQGYASRVHSKRKLSSTPVAPPSSNLPFQNDFLPSTMDVSAVPNNTLNRWPYSLTALNNLCFGAFPTNRDHDAPDNPILLPSLTGPSTGARTVLHDPFQSQSPTISSMTKQDSEVKHYDTTWSRIPIGEAASSCIGQASSSTSNDDLVFDPRVSEPEPVPKSKVMEIVDISLPHMTTEELAMFSRPSPQNFNGPFFMGSPGVPSEASRKSREQELHDWFYSGLTIIERQDEHFEYIKTAHNQGITQSKVNPGPIGTPSTRSMLSKNPDPEPFNEITTRLFLTVHESLSQYAQGPIEQRRGYLAPFCDPPEWCIDKSANGNNSFFGEDWSQPPERISRDSRYRPLPFEGKFGAYDGHRGVSAGSIRPSLGRLRFGSGLQY